MHSTNAWQVYLYISLFSILCSFYGCSQTISKLFELPNSCSPRVYPEEDEAGPTPLPAWMAAYQEAKSKGLIPDFVPSVMSDQGVSYANYSNEELESAQKVCSWTVTKCVMYEDIVAAPKGMMGISFDDGPEPATSLLLPFLLKNKQQATHFMVGSRILDNPDILEHAAKVNGDHIAVHTWSHPYMTSMTDEQILGELGWTMQIILDEVGSIPAFWRPPYGDIDNRVRAIASHVFNLTTVIWSDDVNDWCLSDNPYPHSDCGPGSGPQNSSDLLKTLDQIINHQGRPQERHSGIIILEHEIDKRAIEVFMKKYPTYKQIGWDPKPIPDLFGLQWYQDPHELTHHDHTNSSSLQPKIPDKSHLSNQTQTNTQNDTQNDPQTDPQTDTQARPEIQINSSSLYPTFINKSHFSNHTRHPYIPMPFMGFSPILTISKPMLIFSLSAILKLIMIV